MAKHPGKTVLHSL